MPRTPFSKRIRALALAGFIPLKKTSDTGSNLVFTRNSIACCPSAEKIYAENSPTWKYQGTYGSNSWLGSIYDSGRGKYIKVSQVRKPSQFLFVADKYSIDGQPGRISESFYEYYTTDGRVGPWHTGGPNGLLVDGHVEHYIRLPKRPVSTSYLAPWKPKP